MLKIIFPNIVKNVIFLGEFAEMFLTLNRAELQ